MSSRAAPLSDNLSRKPLCLRAEAATIASANTYHFDWSHEDFEIAGKPMRVKVAHIRLCWSRMAFRRIYPRETQEMVFDAHACGFAYFGGVPLRGIYDNMKTAVTTVFAGVGCHNSWP